MTIWEAYDNGYITLLTIRNLCDFHSAILLIKVIFVLDFQ